MQHRLIPITENNSNRISFFGYETGGTNGRDISKMKKILQMAINNELTNKQRYCVCQYYFQGKSMKHIATELNVNPSTVTRHIQKAKEKLKRVAQYY